LPLNFGVRLPQNPLASENIEAKIKMPTFDALLDTNIYRKNPPRNDLAFQALERLCSNGVVKLHLPYIVEREFQTQQIALYKKELATATAGLDAVLRKGLSKSSAERIKALRDSLAAEIDPVLSEVESALPDWAKSIGAIQHPITEAQATAAMESYFFGKPPLKQAKVREDIPDSFIYQTILELSQKSKNLIIIAEDEKIAQASESIENTKVYRSLSAFIESPDVQAEILELDVIANLSAIQKLLEDHEAEFNSLSKAIHEKASDKLYGKVVHSRSIPDDNHEGTITGHSDPENIELEFQEMYYFGAGEFGVPFTFTCQVYITYYIFKADFYSIEEHRMPSVSDHNDHYYEAEEEIEVSAAGLLKISLPLVEIKTITKEKMEDLLETEVDSVDDVKMLE
jgi:hypothetical protein